MSKPKIEVLCKASYWSIFEDCLCEFKIDIKEKVSEYLRNSYNCFEEICVENLCFNDIKIDFNKSKVQASLNFIGGQKEDEPDAHIKVIWH